MTHPISVNARAFALVERLVHDEAELRIAVSRGERGETLVDAGARATGSIAAGLRLAAICMGGLGSVEIVPSSVTPRWPWTVVVRSSDPVTACLASQYAGWNLAYGSGPDAFFALGSGPARALARILDGVGAAPLSPPHPDFVTAMGRTNDAIIFAGRVQLFVSGPAGEARTLADELPSRHSRDYGRPFAETFKRFKGDFYAIDPMLFSPAEVIVTAIDSGASFHAGAMHHKLFDASFA